MRVLLFQLLFDGLCHFAESFLHIGRILGRSFQKHQIELVSKISRVLSADLSLALQVAFVSNEQFVYIFTGITFDLLEPFLNVVEGLRVGDVVDYNNTMGTTVIRRSYGSESKSR